MRTRIILLIVLIMCIAGAMGIYAAPSTREISLMKLEDKDYSQSLQYYQQQYMAGERSPGVIAPLLQIYNYYGYSDKAIALMESYVQEFPRSVEGRKELTELYKSAKHIDQYSDSLEELQKLSPSTDNLEELARAYSFLGEYKNEMSALARLLKSRSYEPNESNSVRLASLYMIDNKNYKAATRTLVDFFDTGEKDISISTAHMTVELLAKSGRIKEAMRISRIFLRQVKRDEMEKNAIVLSGVLHRAGNLESSYSILKPYLSNLDNSPELLQRVVEIKLAQKEDREVYNDLSERFKKGTLPVSLKIALLDLAIQYNNDKMFESVLRTASYTNMDEASILRYVDKISELKKPELAKLIKTKLGGEYLRSTPLLSAIINVTANPTPQAVYSLSRLPAQLMNAPESKQVLVSFFLRYKQPTLAFSLIDGMSASDALNSVGPSQFAEIYLSMGKADSGLKRINEAIKPSKPLLNAALDKAAFLLEVGIGNNEFIRKWLKNNNDAKPEFLSDASYLASNYKHFSIAVMLSQKAYKLAPNPERLITLAEMMISGHQYENALDILRPAVEHSSTARAIYIEGMAGWIRYAGANLQDSEKQKLNSFIAKILTNKDLSPEEKRNVAYVLVEEGFKNKAEDIFFELAENKPFASNDVSELLWLWDEKLTPEAKEWVTRRATQAEGIEKALWLSYANDIGQPQIVLTALNGSRPDLEPSIADEYINALILFKDHDKLRVILKNELTKETNTQRLQKLAIIAKQEDISDVAEIGWKKLFDVEPENSEAQKELGLLAFSHNEYTTAESLLEKYLQHNKGDYEVNYAYGELTLRRNDNKKANEYFNTAYKQISGKKDKAVADLITEGLLLYRLHRTQEAFNLYKKLLSENPNNTSLRADYLQLLVDNKRYKDASLLMPN